MYLGLVYPRKITKMKKWLSPVNQQVLAYHIIIIIYLFDMCLYPDKR